MRINERAVANYARTSARDDKSGYLMKKGYLNPQYRRRWFTLKGNLLFYKKSQDDTEPSGCIVLCGCRVEISNMSRPDMHMFEIEFEYPGFETRCYELAADTEEEMHDWIKALTEANYQYLRLAVDDLRQRLRAAEISHSSETDQAEAVSSRPLESVAEQEASDAASSTADDAPDDASLDGSPTPPLRQHIGHTNSASEYRTFRRKKASSAAMVSGSPDQTDTPRHWSSSLADANRARNVSLESSGSSSSGKSSNVHVLSSSYMILPFADDEADAAEMDMLGSVWSGSVDAEGNAIAREGRSMSRLLSSLSSSFSLASPNTRRRAATRQIGSRQSPRHVDHDHEGSSLLDLPPESRQRARSFTSLPDTKRDQKAAQKTGVNPFAASSTQSKAVPTAGLAVDPDTSSEDLLSRRRSSSFDASPESSPARAGQAAVLARARTNPFLLPSSHA